MSAHRQKIAGPPDEAMAALPVGRRIAVQMRRVGANEAVLAARIGVDAADVRRIIEGHAALTADLVLKIANALDVRPGSLLAYGFTQDFALSRAGAEARIASRDGRYVARALSPFRRHSSFEFYGAELAAGSYQPFDAYPPDTFQTLTVHEGEIELEMGREPPRRVEAGDWVQFLADVPHGYRNLGQVAAKLYLVVSYSGHSEA